jgi:hypothetical protein
LARRDCMWLPSPIVQLFAAVFGPTHLILEACVFLAPAALLIGQVLAAALSQPLTNRRYFVAQVVCASGCMMILASAFVTYRLGWFADQPQPTNLPLALPGLAVAAAPLRSHHSAAVNLLLVMVFGLCFVQFSHLGLFLIPGQYELVAGVVYPDEAKRDALMPLLTVHCAPATVVAHTSRARSSAQSPKHKPPFSPRATLGCCALLSCRCGGRHRWNGLDRRLCLCARVHPIRRVRHPAPQARSAHPLVDWPGHSQQPLPARGRARRLPPLGPALCRVRGFWPAGYGGGGAGTARSHQRLYMAGRSAVTPLKTHESLKGDKARAPRPIDVGAGRPYGHGCGTDFTCIDGV